MSRKHQNPAPIFTPRVLNCLRWGGRSPVGERRRPHVTATSCVYDVNESSHRDFELADAEASEAGD